MSIRSMTGQGRAARGAGAALITAEIQSVNHRQFEVRVELPPELAALEPAIRARLRARIARGSVTCRLRLTAPSGGPRLAARVDADLAADLLRRLRRLGARLSLRDDLTLSALASVPGLVACGPAAARSAPRLAPRALACVAAALRALLAMREAEGRALERDLRARFARVARDVGRLAARAPAAAARVRAALRARLRRAGVPLAGASERLAREVALLADRADVAEELTRLRSHLKQAEVRLASAAPVGRTLDFLVQEMFRETNTIGAKADDAAMAGLAIRVKTELERIREQAQNIE